MQSSSTPVPDVSVILPCAGDGTRFGAPYPKELHCLAPGVTVLDRSLEAVVELAKSGLNVRLVVVFGTHKLDTVSYLARYADTFQMVFVYQDESCGPGLDGAIRSALPRLRGQWPSSCLTSLSRGRTRRASSLTPYGRWRWRAGA